MAETSPFVNTISCPQLPPIIKVNKVSLGFNYVNFNVHSGNQRAHASLGGIVFIGRGVGGSNGSSVGSTCLDSSSNPVLNALL